MFFLFTGFSATIKGEDMDTMHRVLEASNAFKEDEEHIFACKSNTKTRTAITAPLYRSLSQYRRRL